MENRPDDYLNNELDESPGGSKIHRHEDNKSNDGSIPEKSCVYLDEVCAHFDKLHPGRKTLVLHEIVSSFVHIDVHVMYPTAEEDFFVIFTTGMSDLPMSIPEGLGEAKDWAFAEVYMHLPSSWNPEGEMTQENFWAVELLKFVARMPHVYSTWLGDGHTIPNGPNYEPFLVGSALSAVCLVGMGRFEAADGNSINTYYVAPLTRTETEFKLEQGMGALMELFDKNKVKLVVDAFRGSCV